MHGDDDDSSEESEHQSNSENRDEHDRRSLISIAIIHANSSPFITKTRDRKVTQGGMSIDMTQYVLHTFTLVPRQIY
jgi:hypothetical protein